MRVVIYRSNFTNEDFKLRIEQSVYHPLFLNVAIGFKKNNFETFVSSQVSEKTFSNILFISRNSKQLNPDIEVFSKDGFFREIKTSSPNSTKILLFESAGSELTSHINTNINKLAAVKEAYFLPLAIGYTLYKKLLKIPEYKSIYKKMFDLVDYIWFNSYEVVKIFSSHFPSYTNKFIVSPFPVSSIYENISIIDYPKRQNWLIAIAPDWSNPAKNFSTLRKVIKLIDNSNLSEFINFTIIGGYHKRKCTTAECMKRLLPRVNSITIRTTGLTDMLTVLKEIQHSRIILSTSVSETYHIAMAEALVTGGTLVGPPLNTYKMFSAGGFSGTLANSFSAQSIFEALKTEIHLHNKRERDAQSISNFWKRFLLPGNSISHLLKQISK